MIVLLALEPRDDYITSVAGFQCEMSERTRGSEHVLAVCLQTGEEKVPSTLFRNYDWSKSLLATLPKPLTLINRLPFASS